MTEIAALDDEDSLVDTTKDPPAGEPHDLSNGRAHSHVKFRRGQIADPQRDRACRHGQSVTQRGRVIGLLGFFDAGLGGPHRLI